MSPAILGIDPGTTGAIALIHEERRMVYDTPSMRSGKRAEMSCRAVVQMLTDIAKMVRAPMVAVVEKVHSMPKQGVASSFSFGMNFGMWQGMLAALAIEYHLITPQEWKGKIMGGMPKEKEAALLQAQRIFPELTPHLVRKKDVDRADALLLAEYGRRYLVDVKSR
jgi:crossover junction endodeoxyribonuclease RuvC